MSEESVYLETSFIGYLTSRPSRDVVTAGHQAITREWWDTQRQNYKLYVSGLVIEEVQQGDQAATEERTRLLADMERLKMSPEAERFAALLLQRQAVPAKAAQDAAHIAVACANGVDYILTWNCKHIANAHKRGQIERLCLEYGYRPPVICTPEELLGEF
jgi:predicted nucleic acid-binding protein